MLIRQLREYAVVVTDVPQRYHHPTDPKDSACINLALATGSELVVSRIRHLLVLADPLTPEGRSCQQQFPELHIVRPVEFLRKLDARRSPIGIPILSSDRIEQSSGHLAGIQTLVLLR